MMNEPAEIQAFDGEERVDEEPSHFSGPLE